MKKILIVALMVITLPLNQALANSALASLTNQELVLQKLKNLKAEENLSVARKDLERRIQSVSGQNRVQAGLYLLTIASGLTAAGTFFWGPNHGGKTAILTRGSQIVFWGSIVTCILSVGVRNAVVQDLSIEIDEAIKLQQNLKAAEEKVQQEREEIEAVLIERKL